MFIEILNINSLNLHFSTPHFSHAHRRKYSLGAMDIFGGLSPQSPLPIGAYAHTSIYN